MAVRYFCDRCGQQVEGLRSLIHYESHVAERQPSHAPAKMVNVDLCLKCDETIESVIYPLRNRDRT